MNHLSRCCLAPVVIEGRTTHFYRCTSCGEPCDAGLPQRLPTITTPLEASQ